MRNKILHRYGQICLMITETFCLHCTNDISGCRHSRLDISSSRWFRGLSGVLEIPSGDKYVLLNKLLYISNRKIGCLTLNVIIIHERHHLELAEGVSWGRNANLSKIIYDLLSFVFIIIRSTMLWVSVSYYRNIQVFLCSSFFWEKKCIYCIFCLDILTRKWWNWMHLYLRLRVHVYRGTLWDLSVVCGSLTFCQSLIFLFWYSENNKTR